MTLEAALNDESADMVVAIGGTGSGRNDQSVRTLARVGQVAYHGIAITPGETTALGFVGTASGAAAARAGSTRRSPAGSRSAGACWRGARSG